MSKEERAKMMKKNKYIVPYFLAGVMLLFRCCISPYQPNIPAGDARILVVEGQVTDETGPFRVKLSNTFDFNNGQLFGEPKTGAEVQIFDDKGNLFPLYYTVGGWYETEDTLLHGVPRNTYTLNITTADGTQYESAPVQMLDVPKIDSVYFEDVTKTRFEDGKAIDENWLDIFVNTHDETGQTKNWKWDFEETWEVRMPKDSFRTLIHPNDGPNYWIVANVEFLKGNTKYGWDNKKEKCWVTASSKTIQVTSTKNNLLDKVDKFLVHSIAPGGDKLHVKYSILVKQTALSSELYKYWKKLEEFNEQTGSIYEKIPEQIYGNIDCCDDKGKALGYFSASSVKTKRIFISPFDHNIITQGAYDKCGFDRVIPPYYYGTIVASQRNPDLVGSELNTTEWCADCRLYGTNVKPDFWED